MSIRSYIKKFLKREMDVPLIDRLENLIEADSNVSAKFEEDDGSEIALVSNVLALKDLTAGDIMIPRVDIVAASKDTTLDGFIEIFSTNSFSQIPIYNNTLDEVIGIVKVRDFLKFANKPDDFNIESILKDVLYVVPSMQLLDLLMEIRSSDNHMALVIDEFGGVDGLITLQDVLSEIVGEIQQNHELFPQIVTKQDGSYIADAKLTLSECEEILNIDLLAPYAEDGEVPSIETLGGLMMLMAERMPTRGETLSHPSGIEFDILDADPRKVKRIGIRQKIVST